MNPLVLFQLLAPLLTVAARGGGVQPKEPESNTVPTLDPAILTALISAAQKPAEPLPTPKLPAWIGTLGIIIAVSFAGLLSAIVWMHLNGHSEQIGELQYALGLLSALLVMVAMFAFGSSWGSRTKDVRPPAEPIWPPVVLPPPAAQPAPEPQPSPPVETTGPPPHTEGIGRSTDPSTVKARSDVPYDGRPAAIRYWNPGAAWESPTDYKFGLIGYGLLKDGNHIGRFPHGVNGAAANFALLDRKYVGMAIKKARETWTNDVNFLGGYDPNMVITHEFVRDQVTAIPLLKAIAKWEAGKEYPLSDDNWQYAHAMFLAGSADAWLDNITVPIGPNKPVAKPADLAEAIVGAMRRKGYVLDTKPGEVNIIHIEGLNQDGTANDDAFDFFNDLRTVIGFDGDKPVVLGKWKETTEPGRYYTDAPLNPAGAARINFGQFKAWKVGIHRGNHEAMTQTGGEVTVCRDLNKDGIRTGDKLDTGFFGINIHGPSGVDKAPDNVGKYSAGCLVSQSMAEHRAFMSIVKEDPRYVADPEFVFSSSVLAEKDVVG